MRGIIALLAGGLFGTGLMLSGMTDTRKVIGFLDLFGQWDPTLMFVMGGALIPMAIAWRLTHSRKPVAGGTFPAAPSREITGRLIAGSVLFGAGWALAGLCPGPALASLSYGGSGGFIFLGAMIIGMLGAKPTLRRLDSAKSVA